jgi:ATP-dependent DNA ligase
MGVQLPVMPPVSPMLAKPVRSIPPGASYEPKWDGFRTICFRDRDEVEVGSRNERPMTRYFPELVTAATAEVPERCVVDGEIVVATDHGLDFEALQLRLHPAASRVRMLAEQTPASFIAFDLLALGQDDYTRRPFSERRAALVDALADSGPSIHVAPATTNPETARRWFEEFEGVGLDGLVAKPLTITYRPNKRVMFKIKHERTADCVVAGYRVHKTDDEAIGSLLLGLYKDDGSWLRSASSAPSPWPSADSFSPSCSPSLRLSIATRGTGPSTKPANAPHAETKAPAGMPAKTCPSCRCDPRALATSFLASAQAMPETRNLDYFTNMH